jgi:hypothetical protein
MKRQKWTDSERWRWAMTLAASAMGKDKRGEIANEDPLAWWLLTELIYKGLPRAMRPAPEPPR